MKALGTVFLAWLAMTVSAGPEWSAGMEYTGQRIAGQERSWHALTGLVGVKSTMGSLELRAAELRRFGIRGNQYGFDAYARTWEKAYANLWLQVAPDAVYLPSLDYRLEAFQSLPAGLEISGGFRQMRFEPGSAEILSLGAATYIGKWYLRTTVGKTLGPDLPWSGGFAAKRFLGEGDDFAEAKVGFGIGDESLTGDSGTEISSGYFLSCRMRKLLYRRLAGTIGVQGGHEHGLGRYLGIDTGALLRW